MRLKILTAVLLTCGVSTMHAAADPNAHELLKTAVEQANLFSGQAAPYQLDVDFTIQVTAPVKGHLELKWAGKDRWWRRIDVAGFRQIDIRDGSKLYTNRNAGYTPAGVRELINMLEFTQANQSREMAVKDGRHCHKEHQKAYCVQGTLPITGSEMHEMCVGVNTNEILSDNWKESPGEQRSEEFSNYTNLGTYRYPRNLALSLNGNPIITANVTALASTTFDDTLFTTQRETLASLK